jgi:DNA-binding response OmpR family regulator
MLQAKILVIDDDVGMTELLSMMLASASSEILVANSGREGIELVSTHHPDIIILDLMMPERGGWWVCEKIREITTAPILILSALNAPNAIAQALDAGADDFLVKPVSSSNLIAHIQKHIRRVRKVYPSIAAGIF